VNTEKSKSDRQLRIAEILGLEREPAVEVWKRIQAGHKEEELSEEFGFSAEYLRSLIAKEFADRLKDGESFAEFPKLTSDLETFCWKHVSISHTADLLPIIETVLCKQFRLHLLSLYRADVPLHWFVQNYNLPRKQAQVLLMVALAEDGVSLNEIGVNFGFTRERARQILKKFGVSTRIIKRQIGVRESANQEHLAQSIDAWVTTHPGCRLPEVSSALNISESDVLILCPKETQGLLLGLRKKKNPEKYRTYSRTQILDALRQAFDLRNPSMSMYSVSETLPLTGPFYDKQRSEGAVRGPSQARILQVFGTWKAACEEADVPCVEAVRDFYELRWSDYELIGQVAEFISNSNSRSVASFEAWCRLDDSRASFGTIRNQIGDWSEACELALHLLRQQWTKN